MRIPTVRVTHPVLGFVTINAADFDAGQHELHTEQGEDFDPAQIRRAIVPAALDPALRDAAAALCLRMVGFRRRAEGLPFDELPAAERLAVVQALGFELDAAEAAYEDDQRERAAYEARQREVLGQQQAAALDGAEREAQEVADDPSPPPEEDPEPLRVGKGPGGRWYVMRGDDRVSKGFANEAEAQAAIDEARAAD
ncbi:MULTISPECIES: hypothetical protein [Methylorubrum]|uniref:hypothetical protein n=1 Tax=Methylorubrum TaxID=2282523 RepID=UPI00209FB743|nr:MULTISPECIES: hypothetical protein [Methylorubrum]MCP1550705.1 hypothetical protein [Methylorubrum zatmanii]MCP1552682.1 hypothetical protein [Methylorubrum extorquens]MCP1581008.1 hypothetical protein [Methylorubrum extorquens]